MIRVLSVSAAMALAIAGAAHATPQENTSEDSGFNLTMPVGDTEASDDGWNLGIIDDLDDEGYAIPEGTVQDRLGDIEEIDTGKESAPDLSADIPTVRSAEDDDLIRLE